jgi:hypothetical protein
MIGMGVRDERPRYGPPRIDVKITDWTINARGRKFEERHA